MRKHIISLILAIVMILSGISLYSCASNPEKFTEHSLDLFDTATTVTGYERREEDFRTVSEEILSELLEYHRLYTIYNRYDGLENLCTVNDAVDGVHREVKVDQKIIDMLLFAKKMYRETDGAVNVAMGSVLSIWHDYRTAGMDEPWAAELPPMDQLLEAAEHTNIEDVIIDEEKSTVFLADPEMSLDVGAIAKGYAVERVAQMLEDKGITGYVINVGGNVRTVGYKYDEEPWTAGVENPDTDADEAYLVYLDIAGESVVTSGSYQRFYTVGDKNYHHIIDPETLMPSERYLSVSVVCKNSGQGDALSTALFCMPLDEGMALVEETPDVEVLWVLPDGTQKTSSGFADYMKK